MEKKVLSRAGLSAAAEVHFFSFILFYGKLY